MRLTGAHTLAVAVLLVAAARAGATTTSLFSSPGPGGSGMYVAPVKFNHTLIGPVGAGPAPLASSWYAAQWNNPSSLAFAAPRRSPTASCPATVGGRQLDWAVATPSAELCSYNGTAGQGWRIAQNGAAVRCSDEFDLFLSPVGANYPNASQGMRPSPALTSMGGLRVTGSVRLATGSVTDRCGASPQCGPGGKVDYGYAVLGIVCGTGSASQAAASVFPASDRPSTGTGGPASPPGAPVKAPAGGPQTLFYQVLLADTRQGSNCPGGGGSACAARPRSWYFSKNPYGANDAIGSFGQPCLAPGAAAATGYDFDVLPLLRAAVRAGPDAAPGFDRDPSHWAVHGVYLGVGLQGSAAMTLDVSGFDMRWSPV